MLDEINAQLVDVILKLPIRGVFYDSAVKLALRFPNPEFSMKKCYFENNHKSFEVVKVESEDKIYESNENRLILSVTSKLNGSISNESAENLKFILNRNCKLNVRKDPNAIDKLFGLDNVKSAICSVINDDTNRLICVYGSPKVGKTTLINVLMDEYNPKDINFIILDDLKFEEDNYIKNLFDTKIYRSKKPVVLYIECYEYLDNTYPGLMIDFNDKLRECLNANKPIVKVLVEISDFQLLRSKYISNEIFSFHVKNLNREARFEYVKYSIEKISGSKIYDDNDKLKTFSDDHLNMFTGADIDHFLEDVFLRTKDLTFDNIKKCRFIKEYIPKHLRDVSAFHQRVHWNDIGGYDDVKKQLLDTICLQSVDHESDKHHSFRCNKVLFYGPPGCSKTMFVKALATEFGLNLFPVAPSKIFRSGLGDSENVFEEILMLAESNAPSILFIDEIEILFPNVNGLSTSSNVAENLLVILTKFIDRITSSGNVLFCAATNFIEKLHSNLLGSCRIDVQIKIDLPDQSCRESILNIGFRDQEYIVDRSVSEKMADIAERLNGKSGADIVDICLKIKNHVKYSEETNIITIDSVTAILNELRIN